MPLSRHLSCTTWLSVLAVLSSAKLRTFIDRLDGTIDSNYGNMSTRLHHTDHDHFKYFISLDVYLNQPLTGLNMFFRFSSTSVHSKQEKRLNVNRKVDVCKVLKGHSVSDLFVVVSLQVVRKYGKIPTSCPIPSVTI